ncbi:MAG: bifunctional diaminohydroxyphosphoribosylaminopyrimidine deaminase/5-amino-6-(5-phosphoribosylamino)uracil reductase RibD [Alphaproteobacteria bacterium]
MKLSSNPERDLHFMEAALNLARRGLGQTWPNPAVGCVIVQDHIAGRGWTQKGGRPHAETEALMRAGQSARGATAYVTLEPCAHTGKTPPCAGALIAAGIIRVVAPIMDPDPRVAGQGFEKLLRAGITVDIGLCADQAAKLNAGFISRIVQKMPLVTVKIASTMDGRTATASGESKWITGDAARSYGHFLRAEHDAIMIGGTTAITDDPELTCRLPGLALASPVRVIADGRMRLALTSKLVAGARVNPVWLLTLPGGEAGRRQAYRDAGVEVIEISPGANGLLDSRAILFALGQRGVTRLLVEGGAALIASMVQAHAVDQIVWFRAPKLIGGDGLAAVGPLGLHHLAQSPVYLRESIRTLGHDVVETYRRQA